MSYIDVMIPGIVGLMLLLSPHSFLPSQSTPDQKKARLLRISGVILIFVAVLYFVIKLFGQ